MNRVKILLLIGVAFLFGYLVRRPITVYNTEPSKTVEESSIPECFADICPKYFSFDVDGDHLSESEVFVPTAMTQGAGKILVIKEGKVVFDSGEMAGAWIEPSEDGNGFYLLHMDNLETRESLKDKYIFDGKAFVKSS